MFFPELFTYKEANAMNPDQSAVFNQTAPKGAYALDPYCLQYSLQKYIRG